MRADSSRLSAQCSYLLCLTFNLHHQSKPVNMI
nr:MAG TPA: hypothetical protein [Caudoviricetes sp.]